MADTAAHLADRVLPEVPVRQWVLSFPRSVRFHLARNASLLSRALEIFIAEVFRHLGRQFQFLREEADPEEWRHRVRLPWREPCEPGAVTSIQRYGSSLNLNVHFHTLVLDGVFWRRPDGRLIFVELTAPKVEDLRVVLSRGVDRVTRMLVRAGVLLPGSREEGGGVAAEPADPTLLDRIQASSQMRPPKG